MKRILSVIGARPQFIKAATVSRVILSRTDIKEYLLHTGQHYDENMSDIFFSELEIPKPHFNLGIGSGTHGMQTGQMLQKIEQVLLELKPDWVVVYGDTNSTLAGALAAAKLHIPVAHVEAGLRSFNRKMPEEVNRVLTDHISDILFAPTKQAVKNLKNEGISEKNTFQVGDVMYDAALFYGRKALSISRIMDKLSLEPKSYILVTIHRAENTDNLTTLNTIFDGINKVAEDFPVVFPVHPRTYKQLGLSGLLNFTNANLEIIEPVGYLDMVLLEKEASVIVTDSGGVQKEAFFHGVPCVTLRAETEWVELVELGWNRLVPPKSAEEIYNCVINTIGFIPPSAVSPYGDGHAAEKVVDILVSFGNA